MKHTRAVTEADFRLPEFRSAKLEDYEFRPGDDKPVRKDRWQTGIFAIASAVGLLNKRDGFEVSQVVEAVELLTQDTHSWETEDLPERLCALDIKLGDGSVLISTAYGGAGGFAGLFWQGQQLTELFPRAQVVAWRESAAVAPPNE
ncbi:hypothetical protein [Pseudomonas sp. UMAB-40]|uniref:hypothetical protein n=1 Tax=Pseudomonas sp. UMAB-40 TaxID=1365407 RepID=UPI001C581A42|nr:hypothetical protein [Pseudomonas sp. UMAB-40]